MALENFFLNPPGLISLVSIGVLIALYLIHRKPKKIQFPSISFFSQDQKKEKKSFFRNLNVDFLFWINLLTLLLLSLAIAQPFLLVSSVQSDEPVIAIDVSSSMSAFNSLEQAKSKAIELLSDKNTIVTYTRNIEVLGDGISSGEAESVIRSLGVKDIEDDQHSTLIALNSLFPTRKIILISDFRNADIPEDLIRNGVFLVSVNPDKNINNAGIVEGEIEGNNLKLLLKNYNIGDENFELIYENTKSSVEIPASQVTAVQIDLPENSTTIRLNPSDDFNTDNFFYFSSPKTNKLKVLLITDENPVYIISALKALPFVELEQTKSLKIPQGFYDVYFITEVDEKTFIRSNLDKIMTDVQKGSSLVVYAWENMREIDFNNVLPVNIISLQGTTGILGGSIYSEFDFRSVKKHFETELNKGISGAKTEFNTSIIAYKRTGNGNIFFYGIMDQYSDFKKDIQYPVFWKNTIQFLTNYRDIQDLNLRTDERFQGEKVEKVGFHEISGIQIAGNLLSDKESNPKYTNVEEIIGNSDQKVKFEISKFLIFVALILLIVELIYVYSRGDLQ